MNFFYGLQPVWKDRWRRDEEIFVRTTSLPSFFTVCVFHHLIRTPHAFSIHLLFPKKLHCFVAHQNTTKTIQKLDFIYLFMFFFTVISKSSFLFLLSISSRHSVHRWLVRIFLIALNYYVFAFVFVFFF